MEKIKIIKPDFFNLKETLECGQVFRFFKVNDNLYKVFSKDKSAIVEELDSYITIESKEPNYFVKYFDLDINYKYILNSFKDKFLMNEVLTHVKGIRILNQDPFETIISFIISSNNHIPRIKKLIEKLCVEYGKNMGDFYSFPTKEELKKCTVEKLEDLGFGYRASYIYKTVNMINNNFNLEELYAIDTNEARKKLVELNGVGPKVADCILLFGYHKSDVFPVDVWIKKFYKDNLKGKEENIFKISKDLVKMYGKYAGYAQQYIFYFKRLGIHN